MSNSPCEICGYEHADSYAIYTMPIELCDVAQQEYDIWLCCDCIEMCEKRASKVRSKKNSPLTDAEFRLLKEAVIFACDEWHDYSLLSICNEDLYNKIQADIVKVKAIIAKLESQRGDNAN
ncbi:hypothetical protein [Pseudoalteromonas maricaloris]|uniref:Uncharacterized protein n=1 Tax=Pseudoalteromonas maricaloris TaxID=184924 RepID=A0A8I2H4K6_9GAMM|nr:hypothetical protein [Pseudoalteromonas maricaloris]NLR22090.1 hypothetical protein [Pseudoalteromonas maricaloris]WOX31400.1 hypothetical protein R5H13_20895 [Pseudoalteromonas maricaloris]